MTGTEKQIKWAVEIKATTLETFEQIKNEIGKMATSPLFTKVSNFFETCEEASAWIEFKNVLSATTYDKKKEALLTTVMLATKGLSDSETLINSLK